MYYKIINSGDPATIGKFAKLDHSHNWGGVTLQIISTGERVTLADHDVAKYEDHDIRCLLSLQLQGIKNRGLQNVLRRILFSTTIDWDRVLSLMLYHMPELEN